MMAQSKFDDAENRLIMGMQLDFALQGQTFMNKKGVLLLLNNWFSKAHFEDLGGDVYLVTATKK